MRPFQLKLLLPLPLLLRLLLSLLLQLLQLLQLLLPYHLLQLSQNQRVTKFVMIIARTRTLCLSQSIVRVSTVQRLNITSLLKQSGPHIIFSYLIVLNAWS